MTPPPTPIVSLDAAQAAKCLEAVKEMISIYGPDDAEWVGWLDLQCHLEDALKKTAR